MLAVTDARTITRLVDRAVYVVTWERMTLQVVDSGIDLLRMTGVELAGTVLSQVNTRKHAQYGHGNYGHYYCIYMQYYAD